MEQFCADSLGSFDQETDRVARLFLYGHVAKRGRLITHERAFQQFIPDTDKIMRRNDVFCEVMVGA